MHGSHILRDPWAAVLRRAMGRRISRAQPTMGSPTPDHSVEVPSRISRYVTGAATCVVFGSSPTKKSRNIIAPSWSWASVDGRIYTPPYGNIRRSTIETLHAQVNPAEGHDVFGKVTGGVLVLRGFLLEVQDLRSRRTSLKHPWLCSFDYGDEAVDLDGRIYFLPLADIAGHRSYDREPSFSGLWVQESMRPSPEQRGPAPSFRRVGVVWGLEAGGEGHILDEQSWDFLCAHYKSGLKTHGTEIRLV